MDIGALAMVMSLERFWQLLGRNTMVLSRVMRPLPRSGFPTLWAHSRSYILTEAYLSHSSPLTCGRCSVIHVPARPC